MQEKPMEFCLTYSLELRLEYEKHSIIAIWELQNIKYKDKLS